MPVDKVGSEELTPVSKDVSGSVTAQEAEADTSVPDESASTDHSHDEADDPIRTQKKTQQ